MIPRYLRLILLAALALIGASRVATTRWHVLTAHDGSIAIDPLFAICLSLAAIIFFFGETSAKEPVKGSGQEK